MARFVKVAARTEIANGTGKVIELGGRKTALFKVGSDFHAVENPCKHRGGSLGVSKLNGGNVACPWH